MFKGGDTVLTCTPFAHALSDCRRNSHCEECFLPHTDLKRCSKCRCVCYCSEECQDKAWKLHKFECKFIVSCQPHVPNSYYRLIFKLLAASHLGKSDEKDAAGLRSFNGLQSNAGQIKSDPLHMRRLVALVNIVRQRAVSILGSLDENFLLEVYGKLHTNCFTVYDDHLSEIGQALYLSASFFDHSCVPNAFGFFKGSTIVVKAFETISTFADVRISYINLEEPFIQRQSNLSSKYYFECLCERCLRNEEEHLAICSACRGPVPVASGVCSSCGLQNVVDRAKLHRASVSISETLAATRGLVDKGDHAAVIEKCLAAFRSYQSSLHPLDIDISLLKNRLFMSYDNKGDFTEAYKVVKEHALLESLLTFYPPTHPMIGFFHLKLSTILMMSRISEDAALEHLDIAKNSVCLDENAYVVKEIERLTLLLRRRVPTTRSMPASQNGSKS